MGQFAPCCNYISSTFSRRNLRDRLRQNISTISVLEGSIPLGVVYEGSCHHNIQAARARCGE